jgi:hypothetical protein
MNIFYQVYSCSSESNVKYMSSLPTSHSVTSQGGAYNGSEYVHHAGTMVTVHFIIRTIYKACTKFYPRMKLKYTTLLTLNTECGILFILFVLFVLPFW